MATREVLRTICRKAGPKATGYKRHGIFVVVADKNNGKKFERCFPLHEIWEIMGWKKWTAERLAACWATAPKTVNLWYTKRHGRWHAELYPTEVHAWCERLRVYMQDPAKYVRQRAPEQRKLPGFSQFICAWEIPQ